MKITTLLLILFFASRASASDVWKDRLSMELRELAAQPMAGMQKTRTKLPSAELKEVTAFVKFSADDHRSRRLLADCGCTLLTTIGDIYIARFPIASLQLLASCDEVVRIETHLAGTETLDSIASQIATGPVYHGEQLPQAFTGEGVVVGICDMGFDFTHPTFLSSDGKQLRIRHVIDQTSTEEDNTGTSTPLGKVYDTEEEIRKKGWTGDVRTNFHGTHCLGIAAGNGYDTQYVGVAYESDICVACSKTCNLERSSANETVLLKHIFDYAEAEGKPCVISYSIGFDCIPGDGVLFEEALRRLLGPGRILVCSVGNNNTEATYIGKPVGQEAAGAAIGGNYHTSRIISRDSIGIKLIYVEDTGKDERGVVIREKMDSVVYHTGMEDWEDVSLGEHATVDIRRTDSIYTLTTKADKGYLLLIVEGRGAEAAVYAGISSYFSNGLAYLDSRCGNAERSHNVQLPANLPEVIAVGATCGRSQISDMHQQTWIGFGSRSKLGEIAVFSSCGPTYDGLTKPDVVAPGVNIVSARNSQYYDEYNRLHTIGVSEYEGQSYQWTELSGTSMAAPVVAGTIALWLQAKPDMTTEEALDVIRRSSKKPVGSLTYPNNTYGYGQIDAYQGLLELLGLSAIREISLQQPEQLRISWSERETIRLTFNRVPIRPFTVKVFDMAGKMVSRQMINPDEQSTNYTIDAAGIKAGVYAVQVNSMEDGVTGSCLLRK